jgi:hypothetical protein
VLNLEVRQLVFPSFAIGLHDTAFHHFPRASPYNRYLSVLITLIDQGSAISFLCAVMTSPSNRITCNLSGWYIPVQSTVVLHHRVSEIWEVVARRDCGLALGIKLLASSLSYAMNQPETPCVFATKILAATDPSFRDGHFSSVELRKITIYHSICNQEL